MRGLNVVSLFDGMSCLAIALKEMNIPVDKYYASEIDKYAIAQTQLNFPNTIQLGDVTKWREWDIDWSKINLIGAGSPCQGFSFSGKRLAFDDPRSKLFFVFVEILNHCKKFNPDVKFLLENVNMKKDHLRVISEYVGVFPVNINSNLVSAQNRDRWYWTNIKTKKVGLFDEVYTDIPQPKDQGVLLRDILEDEVDEKYFLSDKMINCLDSRKEISSGYEFKPTIGDKKASTVVCKAGQYSTDNFIVAQRGRGENNKQQLEPNTTGKTNCLTSVQKDNLVCLGNIYDNAFNSVAGRVYTDKGKSVTLSAEGGGGGAKTGLYLVDNNSLQMKIVGNVYESGGQAGKVVDVDFKSPPVTGQRVNSQGFMNTSRIRRLTPTECARLQTVPSWYNWEGMSDTQRYRVLGNGWTSKVIEHILSFL